MVTRRVARLDPNAQREPATRADRGKSARRAVPRAAHASFAPQPGRPDPVGLLIEQGAERVTELLPIRYGRMLASPLAYYRGAALSMAGDLAATPVTGLVAQLCGDAHLCNFGIFASPERRLVFDINDFDETLAGPWEWDVKRLAASLEIAGRGNGFSARQRRGVVTESMAHYRLAMRRLAGLGNLDVWHSSGELDELAARYRGILSDRERELAGSDLAVPGRGVERTAEDDEMRALARLVTMRNGTPAIASMPPLVVPVADLPGGSQGAATLRRIVTGYRGTVDTDRRFLADQFRVADIARKVSGVGSVGLRCWIVLLTGRDADDRLFLQLKEAQPSVLSRFAGRSPYANQGERVVMGQRLMQAASDIFLGWHQAGSGTNRMTDYYVRQLRDWKFSIPTAQMRPATLRAYGALCGRTLARAHARTGDRIAMAAYLGRSAEFDTALADFAGTYADQNERDYAEFRAAVQSGRLPVEQAADRSTGRAGLRR
jgi:uncharacterized protein (DUF2252 family)